MPQSPSFSLIGTQKSLLEFKVHSSLCLLFFIFWLFWVFVVVCRLSLVAVSWVTLVSVRGLLSEVASLVAEHRLYSVGSVVAVHRLSCPEARGILVPRPGIEPMSPALAGRFLTTGPPGKSCLLFFFFSSLPLKSFHDLRL